MWIIQTGDTENQQRRLVMTQRSREHVAVHSGSQQVDEALGEKKKEKKAKSPAQTEAPLPDQAGVILRSQGVTKEAQGWKTRGRYSLH